MKSIGLVGWLGLGLVLAGRSFAQDSSAPPPAAAATSSFAGASETVKRQLEESLDELARLRDEMKAELVPMSERLSELEAELSRVRAEHQSKTRLLDNRTLDVTNIALDIRKREDEATYLSGLLGEYIRNLESRLHVAEVQRFREPLQAAKLAAENEALSRKDVFRAQGALLSESLDRLSAALGGDRFEGSAVDSNGVVRPGRFFVVGPAVLFRSVDGAEVGTVEQKINSTEPSVMAFESAADVEAASRLVTGTGGLFPLDTTLGNAHMIEEIDETLVEHVKRGGPVMVPIVALAGLALLVALYKWISLTLVRKPSRKGVAKLLDAVARRDHDEARAAAAAIRGPAGKMLAVGVEHLGEPKELIEEVMYENVLATRLRLQRFLPFIAITSSSAPLLGLLGTVTGIMNTFTLMTLFGTGDAKALSSGISEALITTEWGLYVAIPSLLLYAFLSRKAKSVIDRMEQAAVALVNQVAKTQLAPASPSGLENNESVGAVEPAVAPARREAVAGGPRWTR